MDHNQIYTEDLELDNLIEDCCADVSNNNFFELSQSQQNNFCGELLRIADENKKEYVVTNSIPIGDLVTNNELNVSRCEGIVLKNFYGGDFFFGLKNNCSFPIRINYLSSYVIIKSAIYNDYIYPGETCYITPNYPLFFLLLNQDIRFKIYIDRTETINNKLPPVNINDVKLTYVFGHLNSNWKKHILENYPEKFEGFYIKNHIVTSLLHLYDNKDDSDSDNDSDDGYNDGIRDNLAKEIDISFGSISINTISTGTGIITFSEGKRYLVKSQVNTHSPILK